MLYLLLVNLVTNYSNFKMQSFNWFVDPGIIKNFKIVDFNYIFKDFIIIIIAVTIITCTIITITGSIITVMIAYLVNFNTAK